MKSLRIWNVYIYLFFGAMSVGVISPWLWFLSGTSPLMIADPTGRFSGLAGYFGGVELLASFGWVLMALSVASWLAIVLMVLIFLYRFFYGHRAGDAIDDFLLFAPSMPDGLAVPELSKYGVRIEENKGVFGLYIQRRYWRLAWPEALAHSVTYLLYLHAQTHLEELLNSERTLFHELAELLVKHYDEKAILSFKTQMADDDSVSGILLDVALRQIDLRGQIADLEKSLAKEDDLQCSAVLIASSQMTKKTKRVDRVSPIKSARATEEASEPKEVVIGYADPKFVDKFERSLARNQGQGSLPANQPPINSFNDHSDGDEPETASDISLGYLKPEVARVLAPDSVKSASPEVVAGNSNGVASVPAEQVEVEGVSQQVIDDFRSASIGAEGEPQNHETGESMIPETDDFERPEDGHQIRNVVCGSNEENPEESV